MGKDQKILTSVMMAGFAAALLIQPADADAWYGEKEYHYKKYHHPHYHRKYHSSYHHKRYHYPRHHKKYHHSHRYKKYHRAHHYKKHYGPHSYGKVFVSLPRGFIKLSVGGSKYYYHDGTYYYKERHGYYAVPAPIGACIRRLPRGYDIVYVDGHKYYLYNGVYYQHTRDGYEVIAKPYSKVEKKRAHSEVIAEADMDEVITLKIPNHQGGYTPVVIKRSGDGFVGPQGEYYDHFPKVEQLKTIYGS